MEQPIVQNETWSQSKIIFFRLICLFFLLQMLPDPFEYVPYKGDTLWGSFIAWVGKHILHISYDITVKPNGSGDTTYNYVEVFLNMCLAFIGVIIWTVLGRKYQSHEKLRYWFIVLVRYFLAFFMIVYGFAKIFNGQFVSPGLSTLLEPYGYASPMGLAWTYMGYSKAYCIFTGSLEVLGGSFLLFRRTTTFGALMVMMVMSNVVALNFCYDIPVKLFSGELFLIAAYLIATDFDRVYNFFVKNKPVDEVIHKPPFSKNRKWQITRIALKSAMIIGGLGFFMYQYIAEIIPYGDSAPKPPLYGIYDVETFVKNKDTLAPLITDTMRWRKLVVEWAGFARIKLMNDSTKGYVFKPDTLKKTITMYTRKDTAHKFFLNYLMPVKDELIISGQLKENFIFVKMKKFDLKKFRLVSRGFHWINEYPYNK